MCEFLPSDIYLLLSIVLKCNNFLIRVLTKKKTSCISHISTKVNRKEIKYRILICNLQNYSHISSFRWRIKAHMLHHRAVKVSPAQYVFPLPQKEPDFATVNLMLFHLYILSYLCRVLWNQDKISYDIDSLSLFRQATLCCIGILSIF